MDTLGSIISGDVEPRPTNESGASVGNEGTENGANGNANGIREPEIIHGYEVADLRNVKPAEPAKPRGRPRGSKNRTTGPDAGNSGGSPTTGPGPGIAEKASPDLKDLEELLFSIHQVGAAILNAPDWELDEIEAKKLSDSIKRVAKYYPVKFDPKKLALSQLGLTCAQIYGPRLIPLFKSKPAQPKPAPVEINRPQPAPAPAPAVKLENPSQLWPMGVNDEPNPI
jgi:hypothetical protein